MKVGELKEILKNVDDSFDVLLDAGDLNLLYAQSVYELNLHSLVISCDSEGD